MKLGELLNQGDFKNRGAVTVKPKDTISTAIQELIEHNKGGCPVCDDKGELVGIITERDIVRKCFTGSIDCARLRVQDVMSKKVAVASAEDDLDYAISAMRQQKIRHLPIVEGKKVIGMISMRDLIGVKLEEYTDKVRYLTDYISGGMPPE
jgi:CBS domain-containing protein